MGQLRRVPSGGCWPGSAGPGDQFHVWPRLRLLCTGRCRRRDRTSPVALESGRCSERCASRRTSDRRQPARPRRRDSSKTHTRAPESRAEEAGSTSTWTACLPAPPKIAILQQLYGPRSGRSWEPRSAGFERPSRLSVDLPIRSSALSSGRDMVSAFSQRISPASTGTASGDDSQRGVAQADRRHGDRPRC